MTIEFLISHDNLTEASQFFEMINNPQIIDPILKNQRNLRRIFLNNFYLKNNFNLILI